MYSALAVDERVDPSFQVICAENGFWAMHEGPVRAARRTGRLTGKGDYRECG